LSFGGGTGFKLLHRYQQLMDLAVHVTRLALPPVAQQARHFAHRLAWGLIGYAVYDDYGYAIGCAHCYRRISALEPADIAAAT
jgi:hypothetical protein